ARGDDLPYPCRCLVGHCQNCKSAHCLHLSEIDLKSVPADRDLRLFRHAVGCPRRIEGHVHFDMRHALDRTDCILHPARHFRSARVATISRTRAAALSVIVRTANLPIVCTSRRLTSSQYQPTAICASSDMRSGVQGGSKVMFTSTCDTPSTAPTASCTQPGI